MTLWPCMFFVLFSMLFGFSTFSQGTFRQGAVAQEGAEQKTKGIDKVLPKLKFKAKRHFQDLTRDFIELEGGVIVTYGESDLKAGKVTIDKTKHSVEATDNVILRIPSEQTEVKAHRLIYDYEKRTGEFINAQVKSGYASLRGEKIRKVGRKKYEMYKGSYTTCDVREDEPCPWKIWSRKAKVTLEGYATAEHPVFLVEGFPLMYAPFVAFPVKRERQTGFLAPEFGVSDQNGFRLKNSFFLAMGRSHDATFDAEYFSKRGIKGGLEYRYILDPLSGGQLNGYFLSDREFKRDFKGKGRRYAADYSHQLYFLSNLFNKASIKLVSDDDYVKDFEDDIEGREDAGLEAKLLQGWNLDNVSFNLEGIYYQSLLSQFPRDSNSDITHKLPEFRAVVQPTNVIGDFLNIGAEASYVNFVNEEGDFEDKNGNLKYDEGVDRLRKAHRSDFFPTLSFPFKYQRYFELIPSLGFRFTDWWMPIGEIHKNRKILVLNQLLKTNFGKIFNYDGQKIQKVKHIVEPTLSYHYSPYIRKDGGLPSFDSIDEIGTSNLISWGLQNRFVFKVKEDGGTPSRTKFSYHDAIRFNLTQSFNVKEARTGISPRRPFGPISSLLTAKVKNLTFGTEAELPVYGHNRLSRMTTGLAYQDPFSNNYEVNHTFSDEEDHNSINAKIKLGFIDVLKFYFSVNYSFDEDIFLEKIYKASYFPVSKCWVLNMVFKDRIDQGFSFNASVNLLFGKNLLSLANLRQEGELKRLEIAPEKGDKKDVYFE